MRKSRPRIWYTVWLAKTDELIASGTSDQCAKVMNRTRRDFLTAVSNCQKGKNKKYVILKEDFCDRHY